MLFCEEPEIMRNIWKYEINKLWILLSIFLFFKAEARLAAKRAARAEARSIRMKELEKKQKEVMI